MENSERYYPYAGTVLIPKTDRKQPVKSKETVKWSRKKKIIISVMIAVAVIISLRIWKQKRIG